MLSRSSVLIVDDIEMNRAILKELLKHKYNIIEADNGNDAIALAEEHMDEIAVILLDIVMPKKDGIETIKELKEFGVTNSVPTILMGAESSEEIRVLSHEMGACEIIEKPFDPYAVKNRVDNVIELYDHKNKLEKLLKKQATFLMQQNEKIQRQQEKINNINNNMLDTLSTVIEYRDVETGRHVFRIRKFTEILLRSVAEKCPEYNLTESKINLIVSASSIHDIGKIAVPDAILLAPRRLTYDEFRIMKEHTTKGCEILNLLDSIDKNEYFTYCYNICRYHHEKWDGMGYPDGLSGDDIPICAQVVSVADCYDALTSDRPYKAAKSHETAVDMIKTGACGCFSDKLMECFTLVQSQFKELAHIYADTAHVSKDDQTEKSLEAANTMVKRNYSDTAMSIYANMDRDELIRAIEHQKEVSRETHERDCQIVYRMNDFVFECDLNHDNFYVRKGRWEEYCNYYPKNYSEAISMLCSSCHPDDAIAFQRIFRLSNVQESAEKGIEKLELECRFVVSQGKHIWMKCTVLPFLENGKLRRMFCCATRIKGKSSKSADKRYIDQHDTLTGLWNLKYMQRAVDDYLQNAGKDGMHFIINVDIDDFKALNTATNVGFGDDVLCKVAEKLQDNFSANSIISRANSDSFVIFFYDCADIKDVLCAVENLYESMHMSFDYLMTTQNISVSIGVAQYPDDGENFDTLMKNADFATEVSKNNSKDTYLFYNSELREIWEKKPTLSLISGDEKIDIYNSTKFFYPVVNSKTQSIVSYNYLELPKDEAKYSLETLYEMLSVTENVTTLSINSLKRILKSIYHLQTMTENLPHLSIYLMVKGIDAPLVIKKIGEFLVEYPLKCENITINITQDMLNTMAYSGLNKFIASLREFGFAIGVFGFGFETINTKCFSDKLFDSVVLSRNFIDAYTYKEFPAQLIKLIMEYFNSLGINVFLPGEVSEDVIKDINKLCDGHFCYQKNTPLSEEEFRFETEFIASLPKKKALTHEKQELAISKDMYNDILNQMGCVIFEWRLKEKSLYFSDSYRTLYGVEPPKADLISRIKESDIIHPDDKQKYIEKLLLAKAGYSNVECFIRKKCRQTEEAYIWNKVKLMCIKNNGGIPVKVVGIEMAVNEERLEHKNLKVTAKHDFLTHFLNRRSIKSEINKYLLSEGECGVHALMIVDIDNYKSIYDDMGQIFGDAVLKEISVQLKKLFRENDIVGRVGHDQFAILLKNVENSEILSKRAEYICNVLKRKYESGDKEISISGSVGIAIYPHDGINYEELYTNANLALYSVKRRGKNNWMFYEDSMTGRGSKE